MGQLPSTDHIPEKVENVQEDILLVLRQARNITEVASLTYEDFKKCISDLNVLSKQCSDPNGKRLVFAIKKGTDSTVFWKGTIRIGCVKFDPANNKVDSYRLLTLSEFLKVFNSLRCQYIAAKQSEKTVQESFSDSSSAFDCDSIRQLHPLTASMLLQEVDQMASLPGERLNECCICLERKPEVMLPCAHSYCLPCIEQWNVNNKTCPICREDLESTDDTWVISEAPESHEISEAICKSLLDLASPKPRS